MVSRNFALIARTSMIRQGQVGLKTDSKVMLQANQRVALKEYQASLASPSPVWFILFMTSAKKSRAAELCHRSYRS